MYRGVPVLARQFVGHFPRRHASIATWCGRAPRCSASTRRRDAETRCGRWSSSRPASSRCARSRRARPSATARPGRPGGRAGIAIVAVGYADGFLRSAGAAKHKPAAEVIVGGKRCPLAGRVSMDLFAVDVTDLPEGTARRGDLATLIGEGLSVDDLARRDGHHRLRGAHQPRPALSPASTRTLIARRDCGPIDARRWRDAINLHLPELRRRLWPLAGQVRRLRRVEHDRRGKCRRRRGRRCPAARRARAGGSRSSRSPAQTHEAPRLASGIAEFDRVTGGGFVRGSVLLLGGDPGIGKSTLLIQVAAALAARRPPRGLHLRRGGGGAGAAARRAARPRRRQGRARGRDLGRGHRRDAVRAARRRASSSSIRSRPCGPTRSNPRPAR